MVWMQQQEREAQLSDAGLCLNCGKRPGTVRWVGDGGAIALVHGMYSMWCPRCCAREQLRHAIGAARRIPRLLWEAFGLPFTRTPQPSRDAE